MPALVAGKPWTHDQTKPEYMGKEALAALFVAIVGDHVDQLGALARWSGKRAIAAGVDMWARVRDEPSGRKPDDLEDHGGLIRPP